MSWRITNRNDSNCYVNAEKIDNPDITYVGFMRDFQPHGLGAKYISNILIKCGMWNNGELETRMTEDEYNREMNKIFNQ